MIRSKHIPLSLLNFAIFAILGLCAVSAAEPVSAPTTTPVPHWITGQFRKPGELWKLATRFEMERGTHSAFIRLASDFCRTALELNSQRLLVVDPYCATQVIDVTAAMRRGTNELSLFVDNSCGPSAVALTLEIRSVDGQRTTIVTDKNWQMTSVPPAEPSTPAIDLGEVQPELWGIGRAPATISPFENYDQWKQSPNAKNTKANAGIFVPPGFEVTLVRNALPDESSWVSMAFDNKGRLTIAREDQGLLRMTLDNDRRSVIKVEPIAVDLAECRGLLYVGDTLYANANNTKAMYRLRLTESGHFEDVQELRAFGGNVGHGRNDLTMGRDGKIYSIHGDGVKPPITEVFDHTSPYSASRVAKPLKAGHLLRTDLEGKRWELLCTGLRNPFGVACLLNGDAFTYDADNEYDMGMPWYRPTRIVQLVPGADYGYREATGQFPGRFPDQPDFTPATLDIGRGSPTAVMFGDKLQFPSPYREALYVLDWTYGRVLAIHLAPRGAGYRAATELFAQGRPLNVTDIAAGPDGAMYLITGGRKTQSALYRIAAKKNLVEPPVIESSHERCAATFAAERRGLRLSLESLQGCVDPAIAAKVWPYLVDSDPLIRSAARTALEQQPVETWRKQAFVEPRNASGLSALLSLARRANIDILSDILDELPNYDLADLAVTEQLAYLRIFDLCREAAPKMVADRSDPIVKKLLATMPAANDPILKISPYGNSREWRRRLALALGKNGAMECIPWIVDSLLTSPVQEDRLAGLTALCNQKEGWTIEQRRRYFTALHETSEIVAGEGMPILRDKLRTAALVSLSPVERTALEDVINIPAAPDEPLPPPRPTVQRWTLSDLATLYQGDQPPGDVARGKTIFRDALCARCHRSGVRGPAVGPDLTFVARRFSRRDMLESIISPSLSVAENYRNAIVETHAGKVHNGRVVAEGDYRSTILKMNTDPLRPSLIIEIPKTEISEFRSTETSPMPQGLLDTFTLDEIRDLLAFLDAGAGR